MAAYSLIEHLDKTEGAAGRIPLLLNLSAWEAQDTFEAFLVDYLCSSVGYEVRQRAVADAFISSRRYSLILDGLDEIPAELRTHFSERLDEFIHGLSSEVAVVVTCRTQEYKELMAAHPTGLGLVQAVEILPLTSEQLDSDFVELAKRDKDWEPFLSQRHLRAYQRVRDLLSNPLFLNLAVVGRLSPGQLLEWTTTEQELQDLVLNAYLDRTLADQSQYEPAVARRYLTWIARLLNGVEVSPFGLKTSDSTVFDLANLTPPDPPRQYRLFGGLVFGLALGLGYGLLETRSVLITSRTPEEARSRSLIAALTWLASGLASGLFVALVISPARGAIGLVIWLRLGLLAGLVLALNNGGSCCCRLSRTAGSIKLATSLHARTTFWNGGSRGTSFAASGAEPAFATTSSSST
jgi:hypothetical protein